MNIDYSDESKNYSPEEINDLLLEAVRQGESYHVRKILQYFGHIWLNGDNCDVISMNPAVESYMNIDRACFDEFAIHFPDIYDWTFKTGKNIYYRYLSFFEIALENGLTEDIIAFLKKNEVINTRALTVLFANNNADYISDLLVLYKKEINKEIKPNSALFSNLLREQIKNLLSDNVKNYESKKVLVDKFKIEFKKVFNVSFIAEDFFCNDFLNYKFFDEAEDSIKKKLRNDFDKGCKDMTGVNYFELLKSTPSRIIGNTNALNTMIRLLNKKEMEVILENYFLTLPKENNSSPHRVADSLINILDNRFVNILKDKELFDFVYGKFGFLPERYCEKSEITQDLANGALYPVIESLIIKKKIRESEGVELQEDNKLRKRI